MVRLSNMPEAGFTLWHL